MMSEEDDVFLSEQTETKSLVSPSTGNNREYTQIYGSDDVQPHRRSHSNHSSHHSNHESQSSRPCSQSSNHSNQGSRHDSTSEHPQRKLESISEDTFNDSCDVYISNPRRHGNTFQPPRRSKRSLRSESSEDDFYEDVHIDRNGATKPLMYPRQHSHARPISKQLSLHRKKCRQCCCSFFYVILIILGLALFALVIVFLVQNYASDWFHVKTTQNRTSEVNVNKQHWKAATQSRKPDEKIVGCTSLSVEDVWVVGIPKLMTESAFRLVDINSDGVLDILFGFATGEYSTSICCHDWAMMPCCHGYNAVALTGTPVHDITVSFCVT
jgi:hypothetical protein